MNALARASLVALLLASPALGQEPEGPFGTIVRGKAVAYQLTAEDCVWAARMLVGEAGGRDDADSAGVLWCMINSYAIRDVRKRYPTFTEFVRAYCTPLQPWLKSKGAVNRHVRRGTPMEEIAPGQFQLKRHLKIQRRPWAQLPPPARRLVLRVFRGQQQTVCGNATQFCSTAIYYHDANRRKPNAEEHREFTEAYAKKKNYRWVVPEGSKVTKNVFFEELRFDRLPKPAVKILPARGRRRSRRT